MIRIILDGEESDFHVTTTLYGIDSSGERREFKYSVDNSIYWRNLPQIIVFDEFDNEILIDPEETEVTLWIS